MSSPNVDELRALIATWREGPPQPANTPEPHVRDLMEREQDTREALADELEELVGNAQRAAPASPTGEAGDDEQIKALREEIEVVAGRLDDFADATDTETPAVAAAMRRQARKLREAIDRGSPTKPALAAPGEAGDADDVLLYVGADGLRHEVAASLSVSDVALAGFRSPQWFRAAAPGEAREGERVEVWRHDGGDWRAPVPDLVRGRHETRWATLDPPRLIRGGLTNGS